MISLTQSSQSLRAQAFLPCRLRHLVTMMLRIDHWSQTDSMTNMGAFWQMARLAALQQRQQSLEYSAKHSLMGKPLSPSWWMSLNRFSASTFITCFSTMGEQNSVMKSPLSGMPYTFALTLRSLTQLVYRLVAMPPADTPVITMVSPLQKSKCSSMKRNCSTVLLYPLKYSFLSLQMMGESRVPEYSLPSQQAMNTFVQSWNTGFQVASGDSRPWPVKSQVWGKSFDEPKVVADRLQQDSMVSAEVRPAQKPPPTKQTRYLFLLAPEPAWWKRGTGVPSRQTAPRSVGSRARVYGSPEVDRAKATSKAKRMALIMYANNYDLS